MLQYFAEEFLKYGLPIIQYLIYLLRGKPKNIKGYVKLQNLDFRYNVIYLHEISFWQFIYSDRPEEVVWSILANPDGENEEDIIRLILERLVQLRGNSSELGKFINQLKVLSMLRNLRQETVKQVKNMISTKNIIQQLEADEFYMEALEKGREEGIEKGREEGIEKGIEKGIVKGRKEGREEGVLKATVIAAVNMLRLKFEVPTIAGILNVEEKLVLTVQAEMKKEKQIITHLKAKKLTIEQIAKKLKVMPVLVEAIKNGKY